MMKRHVAKKVALAGLLLAFSLSALLALQDENEKKVRYEATMVGIRGPVGARSVGLTIFIEGTTSDEQVREYLQLVAAGEGRGSSSELRRRLEKVTGLGRVAATGQVGTNLAVVRERETDEGTLITLVTARNMPIIELYRSGRSTDYPFSFIQLLVDEEGKGQGTVILAARAKFDEEGQLQVESFGLQPFQLVNVRRR